MALLVACGALSIEYQGTCAQQTQQFMNFIHALVIDELMPVINDGITSGPTEDVMKRIAKLDTKISELNTSECNPRTQAVKDALLYVRDEKLFTTVAGRAVHGDGPVQAQLSKMVEAGWAFERAFVDLRK